MNTLYPGESEATGSYFDVMEEYKGMDRRPFKAYLDVGLTATTVGNKVFAAMKGACDGGLCIPHSKNIFPGYHKEDKKQFFEVEMHRERIFGLHIQKWMEDLVEKPQKTNQQ